MHHSDIKRAVTAVVTGESPTTPARLRTKGRPKTDPARMLDLTHKLLNSKGESVINKIIEIALEDGNPLQMQALKMCVDRIAPTSFFEQVSKAQTGRSVSIQVNLVEPTRELGEVVDVEAREVVSNGA